MTLQRIVYAVLVMQLALFVLLFQQQSKTQAAIKAFTDHTQVAHTDKFKTAPAKVSDHQPTIIKSELNAVDVRLIIQEELEFFAEELQRSTSSNLSKEAELIEKPTQREIDKHRADITAQIGQMSYSERVTEEDLARLEASFAKLPPSERNEALGELNRAINSGAINITF